MPGEKGFSPQEEEWFKKGEKGKKQEAEELPEVIQFPKIEAKSGEEEVAEGEVEKEFFKKTG